MTLILFFIDVFYTVPISLLIINPNFFWLMVAIVFNYF